MAVNPENNGVPDTQEMNSQMTLISQQYYTCDDYFDIWGQLKDPEGKIYTLTTSKTYFGRDAYETTERDSKSYAFEKNIKKPIYDRLSKLHFIIERETFVDQSRNFEPAVVICKGRNGLSIGNVRLNAGEKRILKNGDWIRMPQSQTRLFLFTYSKSAESVIDNSCKIHNSFYIGDIIGKGACGEVRKVTSLKPIKHNSSDVFETFAIKSLAKPKDSLSINKDETFKSMMNEVKIMKKIDYIHVLKLFEIYESIDHIILVFPFMAGGDLLSKILTSPAKRMTESDAKYYFAQLANGLKYLHMEGITHRDIKPENILLTDRSDFAILSIADFGLSKMNDIMKTQCGTELYVAPEVLKKRGTYTNAVDIWSSGVVLYAMITGKVPFSNNNHGSIKDNIISCKYEFAPRALWNKMPTAKNIINFMLQLNPRNRLTASQIISHNWLKDNEMMTRLQHAYCINNVNNKLYDDSLTDDLEKTLVNVSICEEQVDNPPKRQKVC